MSVSVSARLKALWSLCFWSVVGVLSYLFGVHSALGQQAEASVLDAAEPNFTTHPPAPLNLVSIPTLVAVLVLMGVSALLIHGVRRALLVTVVPAMTILASQVLKQQLLSRPELFELDAPNTFPSGHMTVFGVFVGALMLTVPSVSRALVSVGGTVLLALVGWQLLAYGWHRPSDVLGALALCVSAFAVSNVVAPGCERSHPSLLRLIRALMVLSAGAMWVVALVLAWSGGYSSDATQLLRSGQFLVIGTSVFAVRSLLALSVSRR